MRFSVGVFSCEEAFAIREEPAMIGVECACTPRERKDFT